MLALYPGQQTIPHSLAVCDDSISLSISVYNEHFLLGEFGVDWGGIFSLES